MQTPEAVELKRNILMTTPIVFQDLKNQKVTKAVITVLHYMELHITFDK